ncbi:hypothetical protein ABEB36_008400 [Hypothenemus hampei]|uniref:Carboxypeptidase n=1 Tax=Hypothenemus hampei TaxID=57062 RepID=A0ABD1EMA2_HYPHA
MGKPIVLFALLSIQLAYAKFPFGNLKPFTHRPLKDLGEPLILTDYIEKNQIVEAKELAQVPSNNFLNIDSYSGYFTVDKGNGSNLFFWFFPSTNNYEKDPVLLWLEGGPGTASVYTIFGQSGPFVVENGEIELREYSWNKNFSVLYIDQPVGTGFSFSTKGQFLSDQTQIGEHLYSALTQFFTVFSELQQNEFYISGESYAGKFVPAIAHTIHQNNPNAFLKINLKGISIGNGISDPIHQLGYGDLLYQIGLIDYNTLQLFNEIENLVIYLIEQQRYQEATDYFLDLVNVKISNKTGLLNLFNYIKDDNDFSYEWASFIVQKNIREALHVGNITFDFQSKGACEALYGDVLKSVASWVSELLSHYKVLIYNGQLDIIVGYVLTENYLRKLEFSASSEYLQAERKIWKLDDKVVGYVKTAGNLTDVMVRNAGHIAIADQPQAVFNLIYNFVNNIPIAGN